MAHHRVAGFGVNMQDVAVTIVRREVRTNLMYYGLAKGI